MLFGSQKRKEKTTLLLDVESGSVGAALAYSAPGQHPKLFGERRIYLQVPHSRNSAALAHDVEQATARVLGEVSEVASRLRQHPHTAHMGNVQSASVFFSAPWGVPNLLKGQPSFLDPLSRSLRGLLGAYFGSLPTHMHTHAGALVRGMRTLFETEEPLLLCSVHGEVVELVLLKKGRVLGHATFPFGIHSLVRTLRTHAGMGEHESRSLIRLGTHTPEPLVAAQGHFRELFREAGEPLFVGVPVGSVYVFTRGPEASWFARSLSHDSLSDLFPEGGVVRVLNAEHLTPFVAAHAEKPDSALLLSALFVDGA